MSAIRARAMRSPVRDSRSSGWIICCGLLNSLNDNGAGFGHDSNKVTLFYKDGTERSIELKSKTALAVDLVDAITELIK